MLLPSHDGVGEIYSEELKQPAFRGHRDRGSRHATPMEPQREWDGSPCHPTQFDRVQDVASLFSVGVEVSWWETRFIGLARGEAARIETVMKYRF